MVQSGNPGGSGTPAYIAPTEKTPEEPVVTSGASVNKYTASTITAVTPKLNQSVRSKKCSLRKLPGTGSEDMWKASSGVGLGSGLSFIETPLPTNRHRVRNNLYGSLGQWRFADDSTGRASSVQPNSARQSLIPITPSPPPYFAAPSVPSTSFE